ncbi:MAG: HAMP domain-containing histidine kinase [Flavobacteriaceae bacterium]|nr:HAMP domain-containing histidine kinase [Flavobacteriaceae bacterium]
MNTLIHNLWDYKNVKKRKFIHYVLILSVILLLFTLLILIYNEVFNEKKLRQINQKVQQYDQVLNQIQQTEIQKNLANEAFLHFLLQKNVKHLNQYDSLLTQLKGNIRQIYSDNLKFADDAALSKDTIHFVKLLSFLNEETPQFTSEPNFKTEYNRLKNEVMKQVLLGTELESSSTVDSVQKKKFFKRLSDAFSGDVDVQKEINEMRLVMKYGNKIEEVTIDELLQQTLQRALQQYQLKVSDFQADFNSLNGKNQRLVSNNDSINKYARILIGDYKTSLHTLNDAAKQEYRKQYNTIKTIRMVSAWIILVVLLLLSFYLLYITRITYQYEELLLKAKEELDDNLKFKNKMVSMISHEVRSPLSIISLLSNQIMKLEKDKTKSEIFDSIHYTTNNILLLSNQILDYSKGENQRLELNPESFLLHDEIQKILNSFIPLTESKGNQLTRNLSIPKDALILSDKTKLHQLFYNILGNANKYTDKGTITVNCSLIPIPNTNQANFNLHIQDTGKGISESDLKNVLDPYRQGTQKVMGYQNLGVGLGLYLCKEIVDLFEGQIKVESTERKGTEISLTYIVEMLQAK